RPTVSLPYRPVVHLADRGDLGGGAGEEALVSVIEICDNEFLLADLVPQVTGDLDHAAAGDAVQAAGLRRRCRQHSVSDDEDVLPGPVRDETVLVQHDGLVVPGLERLHLREDAVDVLAGRLRGGRQRVLPVPAPAADLDAPALLQRVLPQVRAPRPHGDDHVHRRAERVHTHLAVPAHHERADVARGQSVRPDDVLHALADGVDRERDLEVIELRGAVEAAQVLVHVPHGGTAGGLVRPDALEYTGAVVQGVGEHVDLGIGPVHELTVHPDLLDLRDRHRGPSSVQTGRGMAPGDVLDRISTTTPAWLER